jgi:hypothetical protein
VRWAHPFRVVRGAGVAQIAESKGEKAFVKFGNSRSALRSVVAPVVGAIRTNQEHP